MSDEKTTFRDSSRDDDKTIKNRKPNIEKIPTTLAEGAKVYAKELLQKLKEKDQEPTTSDTRPKTVKEALEQGWKLGPAMKMSDPPVYTLTKDGESIEIRGPRPAFFEKFSRPDDRDTATAVANREKKFVKKAKGGMVNKKKPAKKSKLAGRLAMRGYGAVIR